MPQICTCAGTNRFVLPLYQLQICTDADGKLNSFSNGSSRICGSRRTIWDYWIGCLEKKVAAETKRKTPKGQVMSMESRII
jgi:hypothetical protein